MDINSIISGVIVFFRIEYTINKILVHDFWVNKVFTPFSCLLCIIIIYLFSIYRVTNILLGILSFAVALSINHWLPICCYSTFCWSSNRMIFCCSVHSWIVSIGHVLTFDCLLLWVDVLSLHCLGPWFSIIQLLDTNTKPFVMESPFGDRYLTQGS